MSIASSAIVSSTDRSQSWIGAARIVMGLCFIYYGVSKFFFIGGTIGFIATKLPFPAAVFWLGVVIEILGGVMLVLGIKTRWLAAWFAFYCCFTAVVFHTDFANRGIMDHFFENFALAAGFLCLMASGPGAWAIERR